MYYGRGLPCSLWSPIRSKGILCHRSFLCFRPVLCSPGNTGQYEISARQRDPIPPKFILSGVRVWICQPFPDLFLRLRLFRCPHDLPVCFPHFRPERYFLCGRFLDSQAGTPPVRETLEPCTLGRSQAAHNIVRFGCRLIVYHWRGFIIPRQKKRSFFLLPPGIFTRSHAKKHSMGVGRIPRQGKTPPYNPSPR